MAAYIALLDRAADGSYGVVFPDLPGCASAGDDFEDALRNAAEALAFHVRGLRDDGAPVPPPRDIEAIRAAGEDWYDLAAGVVALVPLLPPPGRVARINITLDERLLAEIDAVAENRSAFLAEAARRALHND